MSGHVADLAAAKRRRALADIEQALHHLFLANEALRRAGIAIGAPSLPSALAASATERITGARQLTERAKEEIANA